jgi:rhodanese-related sulfurtransferase
MSSFRGAWPGVARLLAVAVFPALLTLWLHPKRPALSWHPPATESVELSEIRQWSNAVLWVDARKADDFRNQHIPGAVRLNEAEWEGLLPGFMEAWRPGLRVVVYCDTQACDASQTVALRLRRELNLPDVFVLKGGWIAWKQNR